jgi:hypothetical protein
MKMSIAASTPCILRTLATLTELLSFAIAARGQSSWFNELSALHSNLEKHGIHPALVYDGEGFVDVSDGARPISTLCISS